MTKVWDLPVRALHWSLALSCAVAWLATEFWSTAHEVAGYVALAVVASRLAWGIAGGRYARFSQFVRMPGATWAYASLVLRGQAPRYMGHNPLGAWMALALWACVAGTSITGWLYTTDRFFGEAWLDLTHRALAWALLPLVALHLAGVICTGRQHGDHLVAAMVSGNKAPAQSGDIA